MVEVNGNNYHIEKKEGVETDYVEVIDVDSKRVEIFTVEDNTVKIWKHRREKSVPKSMIKALERELDIEVKK